MRRIERWAETACRELDGGDFFILIIRNEVAERPRAGYLGERRQAVGHKSSFRGTGPVSSTFATPSPTNRTKNAIEIRLNAQRRR